MDQEKKEIITPISKQKVVLKSWITGRDKREIQSVFMKDMKVKENQEMSIGGSQLTAYQDKSIEAVIISVDSKTDNLLDIVLDMHSKDYQFIVDEIGKVIGEDDIDKKKL